MILSIPDRLRELADKMDTGEYTESSMATVITKCKETGIVTIVSMTEEGIDDSRELFNSMAKCLGYARII